MSNIKEQQRSKITTAISYLKFLISTSALRILRTAPQEFEFKTEMLLAS
jgi:hypothetical protein